MWDLEYLMLFGVPGNKWELLDGQDPGKETGSEWAQRHHDVQSNLWSLFGEFCHDYGGHHCGRAVISLNDRCAVEPDQYYYRAALADCTIEGNYFQGVPNLVAEVLSPATRALDRGPRMNVYARAGVPHLWLLDPETDVVEEYLLHRDAYDLTGRHAAGGSFRPALCPATRVSVDALFDTQEKRHKSRWKSILGDDDKDEDSPLPPWLVPADRRLGLEALFFFGHPEKRYEIWNNRAPCLLAFGSVEEAELRFGHFLEEICRWEQTPLVRPSVIKPGTELAEVGRFQLTRGERQVQLDVAVDGRKFRELLHIWDRREAWDWGEVS